MKRNFSFAKQTRAWVSDDVIHVTRPYDANFVKDCQAIDGRFYVHADFTNNFPMDSALMVKALLEKWKIPVPPEVMLAVAGQNTDFSFSQKKNVRFEDGRVVVSFLYDINLIEAIKTFIPGVTFSHDKKYYHIKDADIDKALDFARRFDLTVADDLLGRWEEVKQNAEAMRAASSALETDMQLYIPGIAKDLLPYQKAGIAYMLKARKVILGDQPGLGKTVQALATVAVEDRFPLVVVCPNSLKLNWAGEVKKWFPHLTTAVISGTKSQTIEPADVIVINYDIAYERCGDILDHGFRSLVADEAHAIKNGVKKNKCPVCNRDVRSNAKNCPSKKCGPIVPVEIWSVKRTAAVMKLAKSLGADDLVLLLTGTPVTNRPAELIPQLEAIGRLKDFGGVWKFKERYAPDRNIATNTQELNDKLRASCFVRRLKQDVYTELPALRNAVQHLQIDEKLLQWYLSVEKDAISYFAQKAKELAEEGGEDGDDAYWKKHMALQVVEHLVQITALRDAVSKIKFEAINTWLKNFLESGDQKVIVFAEHIELVEKIYEAYKDQTVKVRGGVSNEKRDEAVRRFQNDPSVRIFVANMKAASEGFTLTAASDVVFCELAWTPSMHEQCAGRAYGRVNDMHGATAWYLLAPGTIDDEMYSILERKAITVAAVTDGVDVSDNPLGETSVVADLLIALAERGME